MEDNDHPRLPVHWSLSMLITGMLLLVVWLVTGAAQVPTAITPDGTLGTRVTRTVTPNGDIFTISDGTIRGRNQFHSFERFSVGAGDTASFTGPATIANILSRVTGGHLSELHGKLQSLIPGANLFLLNPAGVLFGPNAILDVQGSFHVSTADFLRFSDGSEFHADLSQATTLTIASPQAFGFLSPNGQAEGGYSRIRVDQSQLQVPDGQTLLVVGQDAMANGTLEKGVEITGGILTAKGGEVTLVSVGEAQEGTVGLDGQLAFPNDVGVQGEVALSQQAVVNVSGPGGGKVLIRGGRLHVTDADLLARTEGDGPAGAVSLWAADAVEISGESKLSTATKGDGPGGVVSIEGATVAIGGSAKLEAGTDGDGPAGAVTLTAIDSVEITGESEINTTTKGDAPGGAISIQGATVTIRDDVEFEAEARRNGPAGAVTMRATDSVEMSGGVKISTKTKRKGAGGAITIEAAKIIMSGEAEFQAETEGDGPAGAVTLRATDSVEMSGETEISTETEGDGPGGTITIEAATVTMSGSAELEAQTDDDGSGRGGDIILKVGHLFLKEDAELDTDSENGPSGRVLVTATGTVEMSGDSSIDAEAEGDAQGGDVTIIAAAMTMSGEAKIKSRIDEGLEGSRGGTITLEVGELTMEGEAEIDSRTRGSDGPGGKITITADTVTLRDDTKIESRTDTNDIGDDGDPNDYILGKGNAGSILLHVGQLTMEGEGKISARVGDSIGQGGTVEIIATRTVEIRDTAEIVAQTDCCNDVPPAKRPEIGGAAGDVIVRADAMRVSGDGVVKVTSERTGGPAGDMTLELRELTLSDQAKLDSSTGSPSGPGGDITIASSTVNMTGGEIKAETQGGARAGKVALWVETLTTDGGKITSSSTGAATGAAGRVSIEGLAGAGTWAESVTLSNSDILTSASGNGAGGDISIHAREVNFNGATISATADGAGNAGTIAIAEASTIRSTGSELTTKAASGAGGTITLQADTMMEWRDTELLATVTDGTTDTEPGSITLTTPVLMLIGGSVAAETQGGGNAGNITLQVDRFSAQSAAKVTSSSTGAATGAAGRVSIEGLAGAGTTAESITMNDSQLLTSASGTGAGGTINVRASTTIDLNRSTMSAAVSDSSEASPISSGDVTLTSPSLTISGGEVKAETTGTRPGGDITLNVERVVLKDEATVSSRSTGVGNAGSVTIQGLGGAGTAAETVNLEEGGVTVSATTGDAGDIQIFAESEVRLTDSGIEAFSGSGNGGNVFIDPEFVIVKNSRIVANAVGGDGGKITIVTEGYIQDATSVVDASSERSIDGVVEIQTLSDLNGTVSPLPQRYRLTGALLRQRCAGRLRQGKLSSLVVAGRDGLPPEPGGTLPSPLTTAHKAVKRPTPGGPPPREPSLASIGFLHLDSEGRTQVRARHPSASAFMALDLACAKLYETQKQRHAPASQ